MVSPLISVDELSARLTDVTVLDVRYVLGGPPGGPAFEAGHIPGAAYVDLDTALAAPAETGPGGRGRHPLPDSEVFLAAMRAVGVRRDRPVVVHDDWQHFAAGRCRWLLRDHGHPDVRLLDGGLGAWREAGLPLETGPTTPAAGDFTGEPGHLPLATTEAMRAADRVLIDARAPERFRGETEPIDPVAGHIPGAVNVPTSANLTDTGRFRAWAGLRAAYAPTGALDGRPVAVYCGSGVSATSDLLALELLGVEAALYPESWSGWITDPQRGVERG